MLIQKNQRVIFGLFVVFAASSAFAEDIGVSTTAPTRAPTIRTTTKKKATPRPAASRPTIPRPIQGTPAAATAPAARSVPRATRREEAVNLDAPTPVVRSAPAPTSSSGSSSANFNPHAANTSGIIPNFKFYFDFVMRSWKGNTQESDFGFDSYHQRLMVEFTPNPDLMFSAELLQQKYFEADYMLSSNLQLRWGRIWIPFDHSAPHSMFGGRINTSEFRQPNETAFLPDIWADLGIGLKWIMADTSAVSSELHFYVVNGFRENRGGSPVAGEGATGTNARYPTFDGTSGGTGDNNNDKGVGARWHSIFGRRFGLGASIYRDVYTDKDAPKPLTIYMLGLDLQLRPTNTTEVRLGYTTMRVGLDKDFSARDSYMRGGTYVELGQRFGIEDRWKFLIRAGSSQNDNRVVDVSDKTIVGATLLKNFGMVEAQINYFRDLHQVASKIAYNYGEFRIVTAF